MIVIGDIHGCYESLVALLNKLENYHDRTLVFLGDYIDRGPSSKQVVERLMAVSKTRPTIFLRGNHEQMLLNSVESGDASHWLMNGGDATIASYGLSPENIDLPEDHLDFFRNTELYHETVDYFIVHAGAPAYQTLKKSKRDPVARHDFLWGRDHLKASRVVWEKTVVFGHTPVPEPLVRPSMIGVDTGCVYRARGLGKLTAVLLPEETFVQQERLDEVPIT